MSRVSGAYTLSYSLYSAVQSLPKMWSLAAQRFGAITAIYNPHGRLDLRFYLDIVVFANNLPRWRIANQGVLRSRAASAVFRQTVRNCLS